MDINHKNYDVRFMNVWENGSATKLFDSNSSDFQSQYHITSWTAKNLANKIWDYLTEVYADDPNIQEAWEEPGYWSMLAMDIGVIQGSMVTVLRYDWTKNGFKLRNQPKRNPGYAYNTIAEVRKYFWQTHPEYAGEYLASKRGNQYRADIREDFVEFVVALYRDQAISENLAAKVTL